MSQRVTGGRGDGPQLDTLTEGNRHARARNSCRTIGGPFGAIVAGGVDCPYRSEWAVRCAFASKGRALLVASP